MKSRIPSRSQRITGRGQQGGFGLVELMVSLLLGLILIGGTLSIFMSNQQAFRANEGLARIQENGRTAFELMAREVREAGGNPCGARLVSNTVIGNTTTWSLNWDAGTTIGASGTQTIASVTVGTSTASRLTSTDAIQVMSGSFAEPVSLSSNATATAALNIATTTSAFQTNTVAMACDGTSAAITQITSVSGTTLFHVTGSGTPGNCSTGLGVPTNCTTPLYKTFQAGGFVAPMTAAVWYIGNNGRGGTSLFRRTSGGAEEIAEGVSGMAVDYLLRDAASGALDSDWVNASGVPDWTSAAAKQVVAVRITLTLVSTNRIGTNAQPIQRTLVHVVNLRNRSS